MKSGSVNNDIYNCYPLLGELLSSEQFQDFLLRHPIIVNHNLLAYIIALGTYIEFLIPPTEMCFTKDKGYRLL